MVLKDPVMYGSVSYLENCFFVNLFSCFFRKILFGIRLALLKPCFFFPVDYFFVVALESRIVRGDDVMVKKRISLEKRVEQLEREMTSLSQGFDELWGMKDRLSHSRLSLEGERGIYQEDSRDTFDTNPVLPSSVDHLLQGEFLLHTAAVCFVLVVALVLRIISENQIIPLQMGVYLGITYSAFLVSWSYFFNPGGRKTAETIGICGLLVLCFILFESHRFFHLLSVSTSTIIFLTAMGAGMLLSRKFQAPSIGWVSLCAAPVVLIAASYPTLHYGWILLLETAAVGIAFSGAYIWNLWPARSFLGVLSFISLFLWDRELNLQFYSGETYSHSLFFIIAVLGFFILFIIPSLAAGYRQRRLTVFEKCSPSMAVLSSYWFIQGEITRWEISTMLPVWIGLGIALTLLLIGFSFGIRNHPNGFGLRTFLCAGVILLFLSSTSILHSPGSETILWSVCGLLFFGLSLYFHCSDLRFLSYILHTCVFAFALTSGAILYTVSNYPYAIYVSLFLGISTGIHYVLAFYISQYEYALTQSDWRWIDHFSILLLICSIISYFLFGCNFLYKFFGDSVFTVSMQSVWLTLLSSICLLIGVRRSNRGEEILGCFLFLISAIKVFLVDLILKTGTYYAVSVFLFGVLAGLSSYFMRNAKRKEI